MKDLPLGLKVLCSINMLTGSMFLLLCIISVYGLFFGPFHPPVDARSFIALAVFTAFFGAPAVIFVVAAKDILKLKKAVVGNQNGVNVVFAIVVFLVLLMAESARETQLSIGRSVDMNTQIICYLIVTVFVAFIIWNHNYVRRPEIKDLLVN